MSVIVCGLLVWLLNAQVPSEKIDTPKESALQQTEQILRAAQRYPTGSLPKENLPSYLWVGEDCWRFLQEAMVQSSNRYTITIEQSFNSEDSPISSRAMIEIFILVNFASGRRGEILYYQGGLTGCREK